MGIDKLRAITYFVRTAEAGSFAAAARSLYVTASALSKALTALEGDMERRVVAPPVRLAVRDGAGLIDAARHGCGLARPYEIAARLALQSGQLRSVLGDWKSERQPLFAVVAKRKRLPAKVRAFIEFARTVV